MESASRVIALLGLKHVGKSSIGRNVAHRAGWGFRDTDDAICHEYCRSHDPGSTVVSVREIYRTVGVAAFQEYETAAVTAILEEISRRQQRGIVATGGGICDNAPALTLLGRFARTVFLDEAPERLWTRIAAKGVPAFLDPQRPYDHFIELSGRRRRIYREVAEITIPTEGESIEALGDVILSLIR
jgi:shikimate kinase